MGIARGDVLMYRTFLRGEFMHSVSWQMEARPGGRARRARCLLLRGAILPTISACTDNLSPEQLTEIDARPFVVADVAAQMTRDGRFPETRPATPDAQRTAAAQATALAQAYVRSFSGGLLTAWNTEAGRTIARERLTQCDRVDFAESPYESIPVTVSRNFRQMHAGKWLVRFCDGSRIPVLEVDVTEFGSDLPPIQNGTFGMGDIGNGIDSRGIAVADGGYSSGRPDLAAEAIVRSTGSRISRLPTLVLAGGFYSPRASFWLMPVARSATTSPLTRSERRVWSIAGVSARQFVLGEAEGTQEAGTDTLVDNLRRDGVNAPTYCNGVSRRRASYSTASAPDRSDEPRDRCAHARRYCRRLKFTVY